MFDLSAATRLKLQQKKEANPDFIFDHWGPRVPESGKYTKDDLTLKPNQEWHGFGDIEDNSYRLDPSKLTIELKGVKNRQTGELDDEGIPASVLSSFLYEKGVMFEKSNPYQILVMVTPGVNQHEMDHLTDTLDIFQDAYEKNTPVKDIMPGFVEGNPLFETNKNMGMKDFCKQQHDLNKRHDITKRIIEMYGTEREMVMPPGDAVTYLKHRNIKDPPQIQTVKIKDLTSDFVVATQITLYPPGAPTQFSGERITNAQIDFLKFYEQIDKENPDHGLHVYGVSTDKDGDKCITCIHPDRVQEYIDKRTMKSVEVQTDLSSTPRAATGEIGEYQRMLREDLADVPADTVNIGQFRRWKTHVEDNPILDPTMQNIKFIDFALAENAYNQIINDYCASVPLTNSHWMAIPEPLRDMDKLDKVGMNFDDPALKIIVNGLKNLKEKNKALENIFEDPDQSEAVNLVGSSAELSKVKPKATVEPDLKLTEEDKKKLDVSPGKGKWLEVSASKTFRVTGSAVLVEFGTGPDKPILSAVFVQNSGGGNHQNVVKLRGNQIPDDIKIKLKNFKEIRPVKNLSFAPIKPRQRSSTLGAASDTTPAKGTHSRKTSMS